MMKHFDQVEYETYLKTMDRKALKEHNMRLMMALLSLEQENESLKQQVSRSNARYMGNCRSVGGVTLPPGV